MQWLRSARWMALAVLLSVFVPTQSRAGVFISVAIAPPPLLVYDQPPCPEPGWIWTPGYWAYDYDSGGYYWVPGTWIPAPYVGALWTPGYWGWQEGVYIWHAGYWGRHVGYYGGVNYGFGYFGVGFFGGEWRGNRFAYNTVVWHVDRDRVRDVYEDRRDFARYRFDNDRHVAFSGGPGGVRHDPTPDERNFMREEHMQPTSFQQQHIEAAQHDRGAFFNNNHGRPAMVAAPRPLTPHGGDTRQGGGRPGFDNRNDNRGGGMNPQYNDNRDNRGQGRPDYRQQNQDNGARPQSGNQGQQQNQPGQNQPDRGGRGQYDNRGPQNQPGAARPYGNPGADPNVRNRAPERQIPERVTPQPGPAPQAPPPQQQVRPQQEQQRPMPPSRPQPEMRQMPPRPQPESRPAPQQQPRNDRGNGGNDRGHGDHDRGR